MNILLKFELTTYFKKLGIYIALLLLVGLGFMIGFKQFSLHASSEVYQNSPYSVTAMIGFFSLSGIFISTFIASSMLFKEADAGFTLILFATPITKSQYLSSRFIGLFGISLGCLLSMIAGFALGQFNAPDKTAYGPFYLMLYVQPVLLFSIPNLLLCVSVACTVAWLTKNKLLVYLSGLFLYITYTILLLYSGSPLMAGGLPQSAESIELAATLDPFGLSAFYHQTNAWTLTQKNSQLTAFSGKILLNRIIYIGLSFTMLLLAWQVFQFARRNKLKKRKLGPLREANSRNVFKPTITISSGLAYQFQAIKSMVKLDIGYAIKSIPFILVSVGMVFYMGMELYGTIDQGIRLPEQYATTGLLVNRIIYNLPGMIILVVVFYTHELYWRSADSRFALIENSTPANVMLRFTSKWISLTMLVLILVTAIIFTGIAFQFIYQYNSIDWVVYLGLYWLIALPLIICAGIALIVQTVIDHKWPALLVSCIVLLLLATSLGTSVGIKHPLLRFPAPYPAKYSEMNGWGPYLSAFSWKISYGLCVTLLCAIIAIDLPGLIKNKFRSLGIAMLTCSILLGIYIQYHLPMQNEKDLLDSSTAYELTFKKYQNFPQPTVTDIKTSIELYPHKNAYLVKGTYRLRNNAGKAIDRIFVNFEHDVDLKEASYVSKNEKNAVNKKVGFIELQKPMLPGDTASFRFSFSYAWDGFTGHHSFNAILENGSFIRLSNYFPRFGYQPDVEITNIAERNKRKLGDATPLKKLEAKRAEVNNFVTVDMTIGTDVDQTAVGIGELTSKWKSKGRNYFRYQTIKPVAFRFAISSAHYQIKKVNYKGVNIEVYYDKKHYENVGHLIHNAAATLDYCQSNLSAYPFKTIRFAEVSQFTEGFAGTAYPATIFMTEHMIFHANLAGDTRQDVVNELAAHELSHQWWGTDQFVPDDREGAKLLTETIAMYIELMLVRHKSGEKRVLENVSLHKGIYLNERGFYKEEPLYKVRPESTHLHYSKGLVTMYRLTKLIGEDRVNKALKTLIQNHSYPKQPAISTDLLKELYKVSPEAVHYKIDSLFKKVGPTL